MLSDVKYNGNASMSDMKPMTSGAEENRHFLRAFIQTYRDLPVLWDTSLRDYTNRERRAESYEQLVPIYRYLKRDATVEDVKKKINTLRTNYRKELKVVECARRSGTVHTPRCWTFHELDFLRNTEKFLAVNPSVRSGNINGATNESFAFSDTSQASFMDAPSYNFRAMMNAQQHGGAHTTTTQPPSITELFQKSFNPQPPQKLEPQPTPPSPSASATTSQMNYSGQQQQHAHENNNAAALTAGKRKSQHPPEELLSIACDYLATTFPEEESIARTWTYKLKRLQREQRLLAEKFINDILFEAESGTLHRGSIQINSFEPYVRLEEDQQQQQHPQQQQQHSQNAEHAKSQSPGIHTPSSSSSVPPLPHDPHDARKELLNEAAAVSTRSENNFPTYN